MIKKSVVIFVSVMTILATGLVSVFGQEKLADLKDQRITIHMDKQPLGLVFRYLTGDCNVPIGFEQSTLDTDHNDYSFETNSPAVGRKELSSIDGRAKVTITASINFSGKERLITVNAENEPLEKVLNIIVRQMRNYTWEFDDGVVNIFPSRGRDERFEKLLGTNINSFSVEKGQPVSAITTSIMALPEFKKFLEENMLHFSGIRPGADIIVRAQYDRKIEAEIKFSNLTFRELLNGATKIKRGGWILKRKMYITQGEEHIDVDI